MVKIQFRAFADGKMHYPRSTDWWFIGSEGGYWSLNNEQGKILCDSLESESPVLMRHSGTTDKNGKALYEGDIVKEEGDGPMILIYGDFEADTDIDIPNSTHNYTCSYLGWHLKRIKSKPISGETENFILDMGSDVELIGNIYENDINELIKQK